MITPVNGYNNFNTIIIYTILYRNKFKFFVPLMKPPAVHGRTAGVGFFYGTTTSRTSDQLLAPSFVR
jgi:hypothetical protein